MSERRPRRGGFGRGMAPTEKAKDFQGSMKKLMGYMEKYRVRLFLMLIFAIGGTIFSIIGPTILEMPQRKFLMAL